MLKISLTLTYKIIITIFFYTENATAKQTDYLSWSNQVAAWNQNEKGKRLKYLMVLGSDSQMGQPLKQEDGFSFFIHVYGEMAPGISNPRETPE